MKNAQLGSLGLALTALLLPLAGDGTTNESNNCFRASTSLAAGTLQPVAGDEAFFNSAGSSGSSGPSSIMFALDNSGSMTDLPQCSSGVTNSPCNWSNPSTPADPSNSPTYNPTVNGTCDYTANATLKWMNAVVPTTTFADPGYDVPSYVVDTPPWSPSAAGACTGNNNCLFDSAGVYLYDAWTETSATKQGGDGCTMYDNGGNVQKDAYGNTVTAGSACTTCLSSSGFYIGRVRYVSTKRANGTPNTYATFSTGMRFSGKWLNANPPKFISARRAIKQLLKIDPNNPLARDTVRYGLATFWGRDKDDNALATDNGGSTSGIQPGDGARLIVPLGPDCAGKYTHVQARQAIVNALNATSPPIRFETYTPLAEQLFNIAQYFSAPGATGVHEKRFGTPWVKAGAATVSPPDPLTYDPGADFRDSSPGAVLAPWAINGGSASACTQGVGNECPANPDQSSICWGCQVSGAIVVTDGMPNNESGLPLAGTSANHTDQPAWDFQRWRPTQYTDVCGARPFATADQCKSYLPLVALYMYGNDFRDAGNMAGIQNVVTHTISFGISATSQAARVLSATASLGGGKFANTQSTAELELALVRAVNNIVQRATSFSAANANALQTNRNSATETFFARFKPNATRAWKGHLIQAILFDEFAMGCDPTVGPTDQPRVTCGNTTVYPNFDQNVDGAGHNICSGVYLVDNDCKEITEDRNGDFVLVDGGAPANLPWDAGVALSTTTSPGYRSGAEPSGAGGTNLRKIMTCVAGSGGGPSSACTMTDFITANVDLLSPAMSLDQAFCAKLIQDAAACGGACPVPGAGWTAANTQTCAKLVIYYVRGYDTMDQDGDGCRSPINSSNAACPNGEQRDIGTTGRKLDFWKLGDIFHSTPAVVKPPIDELRCDLGYDPQCVATIHSPPGLASQTDIVRTYPGLTTGSKVDAYESWRIAKKDRKRVVLAGANDGMLHAFDGGDAISTATPEPLTGVLPYSQGNAAELWAFIPPDLLPRLKFLLYGHQYMVDGSTMVRDIWVDGGTTGTGSKDGTKQDNEFHTVAVISERSGGTQFTGLDVTDPENPAYLWTFPPPGSDDARYMGESWADFAPRPPPIGPVRLSKGGAAWEERWIVMLNGGYDPVLAKGRAVFMVDAWTGNTLWRFTNDDFKGQQTSPVASMFPVPAAVGLIDLGDVTKPQLDADGFFDTATWGDLGGNVWLARFHENGTVDAATGRVTNWFAARTFEEQRRSDNRQYMRADGTFPKPLGQSRSEFYFMTANVYEGTSRTMRTYIGSGNREQMLEQATTPGCGPDNVLGCCRTGCSSVTTSTVDDFGGCTRTQDFSCVNGLLTLDASTTTCPASGPTCAAAPGNNYRATTTFTAVCGASTKTNTATLTCNASGVCSNYTELSSIAPEYRNVASSLLTDSGNHTRFYGFWSYGRTAAKMFDDPNAANALTKAKAFDANRFTDVGYSGCTGTAGGTCQLLDVTYAKVVYDADNPASALTTTCTNGATRCEATVDDPGWFYEYGRECPVKTCDPLPPWSDEKTSAGANVVLGCTAWSGFRPIGSNVTDPTNPCNNSIGNPTSYGYVSHFVTGTPTRSCGYADNGTVYRSTQRNTWSPPSAATARVTVNAKGQVSYSTLNLDPGAPPTMKTMGTRADVVEPVYWMEVPRPLHQCRHVSSASCE